MRVGLQPVKTSAFPTPRAGRRVDGREARQRIDEMNPTARQAGNGGDARPVVRFRVANVAHALDIEAGDRAAKEKGRTHAQLNRAPTGTVLICIKERRAVSAVDERPVVEVDRRKEVLLVPVILRVLPFRFVAAFGQQMYTAHQVAGIRQRCAIPSDCGPPSRGAGAVPRAIGRASSPLPSRGSVKPRRSFQYFDLRGPTCAGSWLAMPPIRTKLGRICLLTRILPAIGPSSGSARSLRARSSAGFTINIAGINIYEAQVLVRMRTGGQDFRRRANPRSPLSRRCERGSRRDCG